MFSYHNRPRIRQPLCRCSASAGCFQPALQLWSKKGNSTQLLQCLNPSPTRLLNLQWVLQPLRASGFHLNKGQREARKQRLNTLLSRGSMESWRKETISQVRGRSFWASTCGFNSSKTLQENGYFLLRNSSHTLFVVTCSDVMVNALYGDNSVWNSFSVQIPYQAFDAPMNLLDKQEKQVSSPINRHSQEGQKLNASPVPPRAPHKATSGSTAPRLGMDLVCKFLYSFWVHLLEGLPLELKYSRGLENIRI